IQADMRRTTISNYQENIRYKYDSTDRTFEYKTFSPQRSGSFTVSYNTFLSAFEADDRVTNLNATFLNFREYRHTVQERLIRENPNAIRDTTSYGINSQDVLIPAFLAAYSGGNPNKQDLNAFPKIPLPNWRIDFSGLSNLEFMKQWFTSFTITHSYTSTYAVNNYSSSNRYGDQFVNLNNREWSTPVPNISDSLGRLIPVYTIGQVSITEQFGPLAGINFRTKKNLTGRFEYRQGRNLALNITNRQITEQQNKDFVIGIGYSKSNLRLPFRLNGREITLKNEAIFRLDFTYRDSKTVQRILDDPSGGPGIQIVTQGSENFQIKPNISYQVSQRLNIQIYYDHTITVPRVSNSFLRVNIAFGIQLRFSLS
ncbi:MAG: cell surface protein SprA, partial [Cytophagales bacterium]|nr:cell surface protein SprA [Cytophagales bacterium]